MQEVVLMTEKPVPQEPEQVACEVCMKEIPSSLAETMEADDYVHHFCGIDCYQKWQEKKEASNG